jgi:hypothetical protein
MKTITIQGNEITYDETLVHVFVGDNDVRVERVSRFNKWSQMPAHKIDPGDVRAAIEKESKKELAEDKWSYKNTMPLRHMRSVFPYDPDEIYSISLTCGMFRYVGERETAPHIFRYSASSFYQIAKQAGFLVETGGSSHSKPGTIIELVKQVKEWHRMGFLCKSDWLHITGRYVGDEFTTRVGTLLGFGYTGEKSRYWNKWFRVK